MIQMIAMAKFALAHMSRGDSYVERFPILYPCSLIIHGNINTSSVVTFRGSGTMVDYSATKGAIIGFTKSLAKYIIPKGIRVNAVA
jgi:NAD(P)-dependent dehydrogenase (short-subunit alcohol dehydrogenase family)